MFQDLKSKLRHKMRKEKRQQIAFSSFIVTLFLLAISNVASQGHPIANYVSVFLIFFAVTHLIVAGWLSR